MAADITNAIMDAIIAHYPGYLNEGLLLNDPEYLESIEKGPLQDDPTLRATYLTIEPDPEAHKDGYRLPVGAASREMHLVSAAIPRYEIGGDFLMVNYFRIGGWTPQRGTKSDCYEVIGQFTRRLERAIQGMARNELAQGVTTNDELETTGGLLQVFNIVGTQFKLVGGESEWYGRVYIRFAVYSRVLNQYWR